MQRDMAYKTHPMAAEIARNPKGAADEVVALYDRCRASKKLLAAKLGIDERNTLNRWIKKLQAAGTDIVRRMDRVKERAAKAGHPTRPAHGWLRKPSPKPQAGA
jgi:hypothetical protein